MFKNISRKGIAFGAVAALGVSLLAGTPASALTPIGSAITTSYAGTGLTVIEGSDFVVSTTISSDYNYYNATTGEFAPVEKNDYLVCVLWNDGDTIDYCVDNEIWNLTAAEAAAITHTNDAETDPGVLDQDTSTSGVIDPISDEWVSTSGKLRWIESNDFASVASYSDSTATFVTAGIAADQVVVFTPWLDVDGQGDKDVNEPYGASTTVTFANNTQQLTTTLTQTHEDWDDSDGSDLRDEFSLYAKVTGPTGYNMTQMVDDVEVILYLENTEIDYSDVSYYLAANSDSNYLYTDSGDRYRDYGVYPGWSSYDGGEDFALGIGYYSARTFLDGGSVALSPMSGEAIAGQVSTVADLDDIEIIDAANANETTGGELRSGTKSVNVTAQLVKEDTSSLKVAGVDVEVSLSADIDVDSVLSINGKSVVDGATESVTVKTDSEGQVTVTVGSNTGLHGDDFDIYFEILDSNGEYQSDDKYFNWEDAYINNMWEVHDFDHDTDEGVAIPGDDYSVIGTVKGQSVTVTYNVYDQFGQPFVAETGADYRVKVIDQLNTAIGTSVIRNGKASVTFEETHSAGYRYEISGFIEIKNESNSFVYSLYNDWVYYSDVVVGRTSNVGSVSAELMTPGDLHISTGLFTDLNWNLVDGDNVLDSNEPEADGTDVDITIRGRVLDANNVPMSGAPVTISLPKGGMIEADYEDIYSTTPLTVYTTDSGWYAVDINTHYSGDNVVNVTAGGKSASVTISVANPTALNPTDVLSVVAPASVKAGSTSPVQVKLVDKWGNGIAAATAAVSAAGLGSLSAASVSIVNGVGYVTMLNGSADRGTTTINAVVEAYTPDKTATATVFTGPTATITKGAKAGTIIVTVFGAAGDDIRTVVNGKRVDVRPAKNDSFKFTLKGIDSGKQRVKVTADYVLLKSKVVPVK